MDTNKIPEQLAVDLLERSICAVQVAAVVSDNYGIFAWGWNNVGSGFGCHAEMHAINRANFNRTPYASIYVASKRLKSGMMVTSRPCDDCMERIVKHRMNIWWRDRTGVWRNE